MARIPNQWRSSTCSCGSGKPKSAQYDARGIFLTYTCEDCHDRKMAGYRPDVLTDPAYWTDEPIDDDLAWLASGPAPVLSRGSQPGNSRSFRVITIMLARVFLMKRPSLTRTICWAMGDVPRKSIPW
jgi:hypothetical protein